MPEKVNDSLTYCFNHSHSASVSVVQRLLINDGLGFACQYGTNITHHFVIQRVVHCRPWIFLALRCQQYLSLSELERYNSVLDKITDCCQLHFLSIRKLLKTHICWFKLLRTKLNTFPNKPLYTLITIFGLSKLIIKTKFKLI